MKKARIVIGANYGDEGKGTVVARYTQQSESVLNILTNGGAQRAHSILTEKGNITYKHFGSGTFHGADTYYSRFFILNPMQFVSEYEALIVKPKKIFRDARCRWSTPYDSMANLITETQLRRHASCGMGIWNTVQRYRKLSWLPLGEFNTLSDFKKISYLHDVKRYYESFMTIPVDFKSIWDSPTLVDHFISDCKFMCDATIETDFRGIIDSYQSYDNLIFENGQGLLLTDEGKDVPDRTPSDTGIKYALEILKDSPEITDITAHYVTRPYLTRHGDGGMEDERARQFVSGSVEEDRTNVFNDFQGGFRYGTLDIKSLKDRIVKDSAGVNFELEVTHCDEMDRVSEFKKLFGTVNTYDSPLIK